MNQVIINLKSSLQEALASKPQIGGFPYLAKSLKLAGITRNIWILPSCQSYYYTTAGNVVIPGKTLLNDFSLIPKFKQDLLIKAIRKDQAGECSFEQFLKSTWEAGVIRYDVDFLQRTVTYYGCSNEQYLEEYPEVEV